MKEGSQQKGKVNASIPDNGAGKGDDIADLQQADQAEDKT
jgi:hypothetical protein